MKSTETAFTKFVNSKTDALVCRYVLEQKRCGRTLEQIASDFGPSIHYGDIQRALEGNLPRGDRKRMDFGLSPLVLVAATADIPEGIYLPVNIKILNCRSCQRPFIRLHPRQVYCDPKCRP